MYEVEAKVPITKEDFQRLQKELKRTAEFKGESLKKDTYYDDSKKIHIRSREVNGDNIFTIKSKHLQGGVESNVEMEWGIKDIKKWNNFLKKSDIDTDIKKLKRTEAYLMDGFQVELNHVQKLGYFLEIEKVVDNEKKISKAKKELIDMFAKLGYSHKDFEKKYYIEMLKELNV
jgi:adenylate cyclase class 2